MQTIPPCGCEVAQELTEIEQSLQVQAKRAQSDFAIAGYSVAGNAVTKALLNHFGRCSRCRVEEAA
jgi:hypothetical protein